MKICTTLKSLVTSLVTLLLLVAGVAVAGASAPDPKDSEKPAAENQAYDVTFHVPSRSLSAPLPYQKAFRLRIVLKDEADSLAVAWYGPAVATEHCKKIDFKVLDNEIGLASIDTKTGGTDEDGKEDLHALMAYPLHSTSDAKTTKSFTVPLPPIYPGAKICLAFTSKSSGEQVGSYPLSVGKAENWQDVATELFTLSTTFGGVGFSSGKDNFPGRDTDLAFLIGTNFYAKAVAKRSQLTPSGWWPCVLRHVSIQAGLSINDVSNYNRRTRGAWAGRLPYTGVALRLGNYFQILGAMGFVEQSDSRGYKGLSVVPVFGVGLDYDIFSPLYQAVNKLF